MNDEKHWRSQWHTGEGSVVSAGSVVLENVPPGTIVQGNPARVVKQITEATDGHGSNTDEERGHSV